MDKRSMGVPPHLDSVSIFTLLLLVSDDNC